MSRIGLFNRADQPQTITVNWSSVGLAGKRLAARDLWKHSEVDVSSESYFASVPAHGVVLPKVKGP